jgi:hypothetical protein
MTFRNPPAAALPPLLNGVSDYWRISEGHPYCEARLRAGGERGGEAREGGFLKVIPTVEEDYEQEGRLRAVKGSGLIHHVPTGYPYGGWSAPMFILYSLT